MRLGDVVISAAVGAAVSFFLAKQTLQRPSRPLEVRAPSIGEAPDMEHARFDDHVQYLHKVIEQVIQPGMTEYEAEETRAFLQDTMLGLSISGGVEILEGAPPPSYEQWED